jgi:hypothetical protein
MSKTLILLRLLQILLGLSTAATIVFVLIGGPMKAVLAIAIPWVLWLTNEIVCMILGKYR